MSQAEMQRFMAELKTQSKLREALAGAKTVAAVASVLTAHGFSVTPEEVKKLQTDQSVDVLDLGMLDKVAGGYSCSPCCAAPPKVGYSCSPNC